MPGAGLTLYEQLGLANKADRFTRTDGTLLGTGGQPLPAKMNQFERLAQYTNLQKAPAIKFKDLEALVQSTIKYNLLPMKVRTDYFPITGSSVLTNLTIQFERKDLQYKQKDGVAEGAVNIYAKIETLTRRQVIRPIEEVVTIRPDPGGNAAAGDPGFGHLPEADSPGAGHLPADRRGEGCRGRQHHHLRTAARRSGVRMTTGWP